VSRRIVAVVAVILALLGGAIAALVATEVADPDSAESTPASAGSSTHTPTPSSAPTVLSAPSATPTPGAPALADVLEGPLDSDALGSRVAAAVIDLSTGASLLAEDADAALVPASTMKVLTSAAALRVLGPGHRFSTRVVAGEAADQIVLVGGGDPALTARDDKDLDVATRLSSLAERTAAALEKAGTTAVTLFVDDSLFEGPAVDPDWRPSYVPAGDVGPVSALAADGGRITPGLRARVDDPALFAVGRFAELLSDRGIVVQGEPVRGRAPADAAEIAVVRSPSLARIVEHVLLVSDNDGAEVLARHVALATGEPGSSRAAEGAVVAALEGLGIDMSGAAVRDGSGLARGNAISPEALVATLAAAARAENPDLRAVLTGLPVARFTGTLDDRFDSSRAAAGAGVVRAKTGTLTGVSSLAGVVAARDGSTFGFAVLADQIVNPLAARAALDEVAAALARCGCAHPGTGA
jgi:serine-type D-Ala-D-Ala carboxypeptidase/endopeptidase (penicillin-binding protein 4)